MLAEKKGGVEKMETEPKNSEVDDSSLEWSQVYKLIFCPGTVEEGGSL